MAYVLYFDIEVSEFELQLFYCIHFYANAFGEGIKLFIISPVMA